MSSKYALSLLRKSDSARILNFSSGIIRGGNIKTAIAAPLPYAAAKAGLHGFTNQLAAELRATRVTANVLQPGFVLTEQGARVRERYDALSADEQSQMHRFLPEPPRGSDEVGWAVAYLMSSHTQTRSGLSLRLTGKINGPDLKIVDEGTSPVGIHARLESASVAT